MTDGGESKTETCYICGKKIALGTYAKNEGTCDECALAFGTYAEDEDD
jgi:ribosome-binding protein aMBF1 (putative translation factor)